MVSVGGAAPPSHGSGPGTLLLSYTLKWRALLDGRPALPRSWLLGVPHTLSARCTQFRLRVRITKNGAQGENRTLTIFRPHGSEPCAAAVTPPEHDLPNYLEHWGVAPTLAKSPGAFVIRKERLTAVPAYYLV